MKDASLQMGNMSKVAQELSGGPQQRPEHGHGAVHRQRDPDRAPDPGLCD